MREADRTSRDSRMARKENKKSVRSRIRTADLALYAREGLMFMLLDLLISALFFRSWIAWLILWAGFPFFRHERKKNMQEEENSRIRSEFLTAIQLFSASLQAGYSAENAVAEARKELEKIYGAYAERDSRIKIFSQENKGLSASRNFGMDVAKGEYIAFIDADDYFDLTTFEQLHGLSGGGAESGCHILQAD